MPKITVTHVPSQETMEIGHAVNKYELLDKPLLVFTPFDIEQASHIAGELRAMDTFTQNNHILIVPPEVQINQLAFSMDSVQTGFLCPGCGGEMIWQADQDDGERTWSDYRCEPCDIDLTSWWPQENTEETESVPSEEVQSEASDV